MTMSEISHEQKGLKIQMVKYLSEGHNETFKPTKLKYQASPLNHPDR